MGDFAYLATKFMEMESCNVLFALANMEEKVQVVARSRVDAVDVGQICKALGGGGHRFAASASVKSIPIPELKDAIFQQLYMQVNPNKQRGISCPRPPSALRTGRPSGKRNSS